MCQTTEHPGSPFKQMSLLFGAAKCLNCSENCLWHLRKKKKRKGSVLHHVGVKRISVKDLSVPVLPPQIRGRNTGKNGVT